jgi:hypothetical protein
MRLTTFHRSILHAAASNGRFPSCDIVDTEVGRLIAAGVIVQTLDRHLMLTQQGVVLHMAQPFAKDLAIERPVQL